MRRRRCGYATVAEGENVCTRKGGRNGVFVGLRGRLSDLMTAEEVGIYRVGYIGACVGRN